MVTERALRLHPLARGHEGASGVRRSRASRAGLEAVVGHYAAGRRPAVLRLYDQPSPLATSRLDDRGCALVVLDEADPAVLESTCVVVDTECAKSGGEPLGGAGGSDKAEADHRIVQRWPDNRNDVSALAPLYRSGVVVDTIEIAARWSTLPAIYDTCVSALTALEGTLAASAHQSHAYVDGACLYFTFGGRMPDPPAGTAGPADSRSDAWAESYYTSAWRAVMDVVRAHGGAISHHHGIGINRARFMAGALGGAFDVLADLKNALDPRGILNPGKLGLPSPVR